MSNKLLKEKFILSRMYFTLFIGFLFGSLFLMTVTQVQDTTLQQQIYDITIRQMFFAFVGFTIIFIGYLGKEVIIDWNNKHEPDPFDEKRGWMLYGLLALFGARILGSFVMVLPMSTIFEVSDIKLYNLSIALTSAVFEEPIFCGLSLLFFVIFKKALKNETYAIYCSTGIVALLFASIHIGVQGMVIPVMLYLMVGRIVYTYVFLKTKTMLTSTFAHLGHNFLVMGLGV